MTGKKNDQNKIRFDLVDSKQIEKIAEILTFGSKKYGDNNWQKVEPFKSRYFAALQRHLSLYNQGEKFDSESQLTHLAHAATCIHFLMWGEDNLYNLSNLRIGLDIDGVLADFRMAVIKKYNLYTGNSSWKFSYLINQLWNDIKDNKEFWLNIEPICNPKDIPFEPVLYCSNRRHSGKWIEEWIEKHNFPCCPVITTSKNKSEILKKHKIDIFVEDKFQNYQEIKNAGIKCFLITRDWNEKYNVGIDRIVSLEELKYKL